MTKALTIGTFDLPHGGHINLFKRCKKIADKLIVALNTDDFIKEYKGSFPIMKYDEREVIVSSFKYVDEVTSNFGGKDCKPVILQVKPNFLIVGSDWAQKEKNYLKQISVDMEWLDQQDVTLIFLSYTDSISSSEIKERLISK